MEKKITRVRWSAENVPWGMEFDEKTGVFSGTPENEGEYIVPVTVETNYGKDTKDVIIRITPPDYGVYAIGQKALTWSENAEPDKDGFYKLNMPKAYKLVAHYNGFGALTAGKKYYCCGPYRNFCAIGENSDTTELVVAETPIYLYEQMALAKSNTGTLEGAGSNFSINERRVLPSVDRVIYVNYAYYYNSKSSATQYTYYTKSRAGNAVFLWSSSLGEGLQYSSRVKYHYYIYNKGYTSHDESWEDFPAINVNVLPENGSTAFDECVYTSISSVANALRYLHDDKQVSYTPSGSFTQFYVGKKVFQYTNRFIFLTEDGYLNGQPENFTHGVIKDAWAYGSTYVVQTTANQLYEYVSSSNTWNLLGTYDIKKVEVPSTNQVFILTNDGRLFHKGNTVTGLFDEAHETLTHIYPTLTFKDFTFGGNTLTVLRE